MMETLALAQPLMPTAEAKNTKAYADAADLRWAVRHWAAKMDVQVRVICIRPMTRKWASISTRGRLTINTDVLALPRELAEFVIVHELVHLLAPNHGKVFKTFMSAYLPDWEKRERRLRERGISRN